MNPVWVAFVAACSALLASIVGPLVTLAISRRQFRANVVSANREKWIGTLRETTAEFISLAAAAAVHGASPHAGRAPGHARLRADPALLPRFERLVLVRWNLRLLLNPTEPAHGSVVRAVDTVTSGLVAGTLDEASLPPHVEAIAAATQVVIREAWQRVKRGT